VNRPAVVGQSIPRLEDERFLTGTGQFTADIDLPGQAFAVVVRSPHAHALIRSIDAAEAFAMDGVLGVFTAADLRERGIQHISSATENDTNADGSAVPEKPQYPLATDRVRYVGEPVALIVAETAAAAEEAAEQVYVDYEELAAVTDGYQALEPGAPALWPEHGSNLSCRWGGEEGAEVAEALSTAAHVIDLEADIPRRIISFMEPRGCLAQYDGPADRLTLHVGCQSASGLRTGLAGILGVVEDSLRVVVPDVGGSFGARGHVYPEFVLTAFAARQIGRPVKWVAGRGESFLSDSQARAQTIKAKLALDAEGHFLALDLATTWSHGAYLGPRALWVLTTWMKPMICGPYAIPLAGFRLDAVATNTAPIASYRGVARSEPGYVIERLIDKAAQELGINPVDLRRRNIIPRNAMPWRSAAGAMYAPAELESSLDKALAAADWTGFPTRRADSEARGWLRGIGVGFFIMNAGGVPNEWAEIHVQGDGAVIIHTGTQDTGMSHETTLAQVAADRLGVDPELVRVIDGDTDRIAFSGGAHGSRCMRIGGGAVVQSAEAVIEQGKLAAADLLEAANADIVFEGAEFVIRGTDRRIGLFDVAKSVETDGHPLLAAGMFEVSDMSYPSGCHICEVEIDPGTGGVSVRRFTSVVDPGVAVNPMVVEGQIHGGVAQSIGEALMEHVVYDPETGQLLSGNFPDFAIPKADDLPAFTVLLNPQASTDNPLGVKGVGEAGCIGVTAAAVNAVVDALAPHGVRHIDMPVTSQRIWSALNDTS